MTAFNSLSIFHQWLLAEPSGHAPVRTIMLHGDATVFSDHMLEEIADYLNEYDDDDAGCWLAATSGLVRQVSEDEHLLQLLEIAEICPPGSSRSIRNTLVALGTRGHVIIRAVVPPDKELELPLAFHAGIGTLSNDAVKCHLVLNHELMDPASLAHIIGDVFLEWLHRELHRVAPRATG